MDWRDIYNERRTTAEEAVKRIKSNDRVALGNAAGIPTYITNAMAANYEAYRNVEIVHMLPFGDVSYVQEGMEPHFRHNALFVGAKTRDTIKAGHGDFTPCYFYQIPHLFSEALPLDVAIIQVSPPDEHGYCSCGVAVDYTKTSAEQAKCVIAQINTQMPRTLGDTFLHISQFDCIVECDIPLVELPAPVITDVERAIGENCASLIRDGDCLQLGIGSIPDAVLLFLKEKKNLGIHTEMFSDGAVDLVEAGVINNRLKNFHTGKMIATFLLGTKKLYDFVHNNPMVNLYPASYTNDPLIAGQNDNLVSINSCVQIDLLGQVCSETIGSTQISGTGGQVDFIRASAISKGGRSIIAMPSTTGKGNISKIVPVLDEGAVVTTNRCDVEYVITEYGIANLKSRTVRDRARMLINIAHPDFRDNLIQAFEKRFNAKFERS